MTSRGPFRPKTFYDSGVRAAPGEELGAGISQADHEGFPVHLFALGEYTFDMGVSHLGSDFPPKMQQG